MRQPAVRFADVSREHGDLAVESFSPQLFDERRQGGGGQDVAVEPLASGDACLPPDKDVNALQIGEAVQEQSEHHFTEKSIAAREENGVSTENLPEIDHDCNLSDL